MARHGTGDGDRAEGAFHLRFIAGAVTGALVKTVVAPVERLKLLWETQTMFVPANQLKYTSITGAIKTIYAEEGVRGLFRGNLINIIRTGPNSAIKFMSYDLFSKSLGNVLPEDRYSFARAFVSGALSGAAQVAVTYPLDVVRSRVMIGRGYNGIYDCFLRTYREEGLRGFYRGLVPTLGVYDWTKRVFHHDEKGRVGHRLFFAALASLIAGSTTVPIDVVRRRLQLQGSVHRKEVMYDGALDAFRKIYRSEGIRGLYRGVSFQVLRSVPATSLQLVLYDAIKAQLGLH